jgi:hypothetical protein
MATLGTCRNNACAHEETVNCYEWKPIQIDGWLVYHEPGPNGKDITVKVNRAAAISMAKQVANQHGYTYPNDEAALNDFIAVHWAQWEPFSAPQGERGLPGPSVPMEVYMGKITCRIFKDGVLQSETKKLAAAVPIEPRDWYDAWGRHYVRDYAAEKTSNGYACWKLEEKPNRVWVERSGNDRRVVRRLKAL